MVELPPAVSFQLLLWTKYDLPLGSENDMPAPSARVVPLVQLPPGGGEVGGGVGGGGAVTLTAFWKAPLMGWIDRAACCGVTGAEGSSRQAKPAATETPMTASAKPNANLRATLGRRCDGT